MLKLKHTVTICVDVEHHLKMQKFIDQNINTIGGISNFIDDRKSYATFETKDKMTDIAIWLQNFVVSEVAYPSVTIMGSLIIVN